MEQEEIIALGEEARVFLNSKIFVYLSERASAEIEAATSELVTVNAEDPVKIRSLQNVVSRFESFDSWLRELVLVGDTAYEQYLDEGE